MESCLSACTSPWSEGLSAPSRSLWPMQVAPINMECENSAAVESHGLLQGAVDHTQMLEKLIMRGTSTSTSEQAAARSTAVRSTNRAGDHVKNCDGSNAAGCEDMIENKALAALRRIQREGISSCKRAAASSALCAAAAMASKNEAESLQAAAARVRARRGEATDKHSISERTRRTKISDGMRALHRLIPDASKTNKASMLDEVIHYVSMLQARLKVECMKKLDGRGDTPTSLSLPNSAMDKEGWRRSCNRMYVNRMIERVLDPLEDQLAEAERQVMTRLAHPSHDLSLAAAYLSSAGLTLLPISHLSSISDASTTNIHNMSRL